MKCFQSDPTFMLNVLQEVQLQVENLDVTEDLCSVAETAALLKEALKSGEGRDVSTSSDPLNMPEIPEVSEKVTDPFEVKPISAEVDPELSRMSTEDEMVDLCDEMLALIASKMPDKINHCTAQELRRLLSVYSLLPFQADRLIQEIEKEVEGRLPQSDSIPRVTVEEILQDAKAKNEIVQKVLFHQTDSSSLSTTLKNSVMSLFRASDKAGPEETNLPEDLALMIRESIASTLKVSASLQGMRSTLNVSIDTIGQQASEGMYFELGRCQELIANYRLVEFSTGTRRSRYDKERRKEISKRVLSRLLP